jgi:uncharacterized protein YfcZ (UPF0381/DUF406 family)
MPKDFSQHGRFADVAEMIDNNDHTRALALVYKRLDREHAAKYLEALNTARDNCYAPDEIELIDMLISKRRTELKRIVRLKCSVEDQTWLRTLV